LSKDEREPLKHRETASLAAYKDYLQGRFLWNKRTPEDVFNSISVFHSALEKDPSYAVAYSGMADAYNILGYYSILSPSEPYPLAKNADLEETAFYDPESGQLLTGSMMDYCLLKVTVF